jgi:membrane peptidoglycan carboxypeptidase
VWMGYPNKRVSMTSVHGEPQQGGHLPAVIWHEYMSAVLEGQSCAQFPSAKESISYRPFYGKYATTGHSQYVAPVPLGPPPAPSEEKNKSGPLGAGPQETGGAPPAGPPATPPGRLKHGGPGEHKAGGAPPH